MFLTSPVWPSRWLEFDASMRERYLTTGDILAILRSFSHEGITISSSYNGKTFCFGSRLISDLEFGYLIAWAVSGTKCHTVVHQRSTHQREIDPLLTLVSVVIIFMLLTEPVRCGTAPKK